MLRGILGVETIAHVLTTDLVISSFLIQNRFELLVHHFPTATVGTVVVQNP